MSFNTVKFKTIYPEFSSLTDIIVEYRGTQGDKTLSDTTWGDLREEALFLWTAHYLAIQYNIAKGLKQNGKNSINPGLVNSQSASNASLSNSYSHSNMVSGDDPFRADFARTSYGLEYLSMMETTMGNGHVVISK